MEHLKTTPSRHLQSTHQKCLAAYLGFSKQLLHVRGWGLTETTWNLRKALTKTSVNGSDVGAMLVRGRAFVCNDDQDYIGKHPTPIHRNWT